MKITLTPGQAVTIHGWMRARQTLCWGDVLCTDGVDFAKLHGACKIPEASLHALQPDLHAWIKNDRAVLRDCPTMRSWAAHPTKDFKADLSEMISMNWDVATLQKMAVTYEDFLEIGLTPENMQLFNLTLVGWSALGFKRKHAETVNPAILYRLFGMPRQDVLASLAS